MMQLDRSFYKGKRVLVTGHTGFIGSWITKWLLMLGADVCGYALRPPTEPNLYSVLSLEKGIRDVNGNILDQEKLDRCIRDFSPEIVFHLAAQPLVLESIENPVETINTNVMGTANLLNSLRGSGSVRAIVVFTSDKVYRNLETGRPFLEEDPLGGRDPYSASKSCQDIVSNSFRETYFNDLGVKLSSVRAGNVIGGGDWATNRIVPDIVRSITSGIPIKLRNPNAVRPWQHVLEPVRGILLLAQKMWHDSTYASDWNLGPDVDMSMTVEELTKEIIKEWGDGKYLIERGSLDKESKTLRLDVSKSNIIQDQRESLDLINTIKLTIQWYKTYYSSPSMIGNLLLCQF